MLKTKEDLITNQCSDIDWNFKANHTKKSYQTVKDLTSRKQRRLSRILDKNRWTEYAADLYLHQTTGDAQRLNIPPSTDTESIPILREEMEEAVKSLRKGELAGGETHFRRTGAIRKRSHGRCTACNMPENLGDR